MATGIQIAEHHRKNATAEIHAVRSSMFRGIAREVQNIISDKVDTTRENAIRDATARTLNDMCREQVQSVVLAAVAGVIWNFVSAALYRSLRTATFPRRDIVNSEDMQHE